MDGRRDIPASPLHLSETPLHIRLPAPALGEHNDYIFRHLLGLSDDQVAALA
jgi:crotonobetainyl-CoA:carnitine CoA-transferase CaiB-like acyl-CoA transferase